MSKVGPEGRSFLPIDQVDLLRLAQIARTDREDFFRDHSEWAKLYKRRVLCIALCQGGAKHYLDGVTGINDLDVYTFYKENPKKRWYAKRRKFYDFGVSKFGQSIDHPLFIGRRVDCLARAIDIKRNESVAHALQRYLQEGKTKTAKLLAMKAVVLLEPNCGTVVWPSIDAITRI